MFKIAALNKISPAGLSQFGDGYAFTDDVLSADGVLVRSHDMLHMDFSENLLAIARAGAGVNNIPVDSCAEKGIVVFNTPGANANAVKELVISALFLAARNLPAALEWVKTLTSDVAKETEKGKGQFAGSEIEGKTLGVAGLGAIGVMVANAAEKLGMDVIGYDPFITVDSAHRLSNRIPVVTDLGDMLPRCDYLSIHIPAMESTKGMFNRDMFAQMKKGVCFLNFSRDNLVNHGDLLSAIESGAVGKYITDFPSDALLGKDGVVFIPHLGASTEEAEDCCAAMAAEQLIDYLENGNIVNSVNYPTCDMGPFGRSQAVSRVCILNKNKPAMLSRITGIFADSDINIRNMTNTSMGGYACTMIDVDSEVDSDALTGRLKFDGIISVRIIR
ncbi:MAG: 3-phosphoglycerate dehydrogenase family protein [Clostridiales bacterium]|nr:3-phosphoglycerate dehydrogenase family protein [Clostridiales bacterium]